MNYTYEVERMLHRCPEIDCSDYETYPGVSDEVMMVMEQNLYDETTLVHVFPFVRENDAGTKYIELYFWNVMLYPDNWERFVIRDGFCLPKEQEERFLHYTRREFLWLDCDLEKRLCDKVTQYFPQWHFEPDTEFFEGRELEHLYFVSFPSGSREILYKAGLSNIACALDEMSYNLIGTTPETIIGHNLPLRLLRILNQPNFREILLDEKQLEHSRAVYEKYSGYLGKKLPNITQWAYLDALYKNGGMFGGHGFLRSMYDKLSLVECVGILYEYEQFLTLRDAIPGLRKLKIPKPMDVWGMLMRLEKLRKSRKENKKLNALIRKRKESDHYEYTGDEYFVKMPESLFEFFSEAVEQGNCVMDYVKEHASGKTTILFLRRKEEPGKSFVTMEVRDQTIKQVYGKFNTRPKKKVLEFLMDYARDNWLHCDRYRLILDAMDEMDEIDCMDYEDEELWEDPDEYDELSDCPDYDDEELCEQLRMEDSFPDIFKAG